MRKTIEKIKHQLQTNMAESVRISNQRFFKEQVQYYGVKSKIIDKIAKEIYKEIKEQSKQEIFSLCELLWQSGYMEEMFIACQFSYRLHKNFEATDFQVFEHWISKYITNWATCDTFCNHTIGAFLDKYPDYTNQLKVWAKSNNPWLRRAAAVSLIVPAKQGHFLNEIFEIANILLLDKEDLVQKGYGWLLKVTANKHEQAVFNYVIAKKAVMPRTALRYAIEKMPKNLKIQAMAKT